MYPITRTALHPSHKYLACQSSDNQVLVYGADKFRQNRKKSYRGHNNAGTAIDLAFSPDGQFLASGDSAGFVAFCKCIIVYICPPALIPSNTYYTFYSWRAVAAASILPPESDD